jgi:bacteriorhodopsin
MKWFNLFLNVSTKKTKKLSLHKIVLEQHLVLLYYVPNRGKRTILGIEFIITAIASYVYSKYNQSIHEHQLSHTTLGWKGVNHLRYFDWAFITPLMLISLSLLFMNSEKYLFRF